MRILYDLCRTGFKERPPLFEGIFISFKICNTVLFKEKSVHVNKILKF